VQKDYVQAHRLLEQASDQGVAIGSLLLGTLYERGLGVPKDIWRAIALYEIAARIDHTDAFLYLARIYRAGKGVAKDVRAAVRAYQKVFDQELRVDDPLWQAVHEAKTFLERLYDS
jgi:TPR repeat protein